MTSSTSRSKSSGRRTQQGREGGRIIRKKNLILKIIQFFFKGSGPISRIWIRSKVVRIRNTGWRSGPTILQSAICRLRQKMKFLFSRSKMSQSSNTTNCHLNKVSYRDQQCCGLLQLQLGPNVKFKETTGIVPQLSSFSLAGDGVGSK